ncbi:alpha-(1,3)-fucosyltransferase 9-like [Myripristis murdjan]|uniref:alpha-(1,3)-fucosyltransferase 9-like n=1 Tax=Myripristis murdjan TaxID=586833 RepID=UPI001175CE8D|nr:alpha-(1,3)-fucosyltransferase 9-like [Myripristis murdjan]
MSSSVLQWVWLRHCVFATLMVLCVLGVFIMYYKPDISIPTFNIHMVSQKEGDNHSRPTVVCPQQPNCSSEQNINQVQKIQAAEGDAEPDTIILIWMWPFGFKFDLSCRVFGITGCHLTDDKSLYRKAHGVLFHHRDIHGDLGNMPKEPRPWFQKWVWSNAESPANSGRIPGLDHLFNLTCNYRRDADIPVPYGYLVPVTDRDQSFELPAKDKLVCWIVSNWNPNFKRVQFYNKLKNHINIDIYGKAFGQHLNNQDFPKIISSCKFYLSFENSIHTDYITEKLYNPLMMGTVPVVLGPTRQNYENYIPGDSFIHVDDFASPKELAERLLYLDQHPAEYSRYLNWREHFKVKISVLGFDHACKTCHYLENHRGYQAFHDLNKWYWG